MRRLDPDDLFGKVITNAFSAKSPKPTITKTKPAAKKKK
jgi:hypothetical protein